MKTATKQSLFFTNSAALLLSEGIYDLVLANMAFNISGKAFTGAATYAIGYVAEIVVSVFGSGFLDRFDRRKVFVGVLAVKLSLFLAAFLYGTHEGFTALTIMAFAFVIDLANHCSRLTTNSLTVSLFDKDEIPAVQGTGALVSGLAKLAAPVLGAGLIAAIGSPSSLAVSAAFQVTALVASLILFYQSKLVGASKSQSELGTSRIKDSLLGTLRAAREMVSDRRWANFLTVYTLSAMVLGTAALEWLPLLRTFHGVAESETGLFTAAGALGMVGAGLIMRWTKGLDPSGRVLALSMFIQAGAMILAAVVQSRLAAIAGILVFHIGLAYYFRSTAIIIQRAIPVERMGSCYGVIDALGRVFGLFGILGVGYLFDLIGGSALYVGLAAVLSATAFVWLKGISLTEVQTEAA